MNRSPTRRSKGPRWAFPVACGASLLCHVSSVAWLMSRTVAGTGPHSAAGAWASLDAPESALVDLTSEAEALPVAEQASVVSAAHEADEARRGPSDDARAGGADRRAPAPDTGAAAGRAVAEAWRRDRSTLRTRVSDGATVYQMARDRTSTRASSPQAVRQVPRPGPGDAPGDERVAMALPTPAVDLATAAGSDDGTRALEDARTAASPDPDAAGQRRAEGRLDVAAGLRRFDTPDLGPARERVDERQASNELHPGLMELTAVGAPGPRQGVAGRGVAVLPGATSDPSHGAAPVRAGTPGTSGSTPADAAALERQYARHFQEISRRVGQVLVFPRRLAVRLEQGESIVRFVVRSDGRLGGGVELVKSAGFAEFDAEAVRAVERAAPFPTIGQQRLVELRVPFQNPMVK